MDRAAAVVQCDMVISVEMTRRIPPPPNPPKQSVNIAIGRGSPPPGHDQVKWMVVDAAGERLHDDDLTFPEAWKLKEQLAGGRKVVSPRIEQAAAVEVTAPVDVLTPLGVPPGVPRPKSDLTAAAAASALDDVPEVAAAVLADEELEEMLKDIG